MAAQASTPSHTLRSESRPCPRRATSALAILTLLLAAAVGGPPGAQADEPDGEEPPATEAAESLVLWLADPDLPEMAETGTVTLTPALDGRTGGLALQGAVVDAEGRPVTDTDPDLRVRLTVEGEGSLLALDLTGAATAWTGAVDVPVTDGRLTFDPQVVLAGGIRGSVTIRAQDARLVGDLGDAELEVVVTGPPDPDADVRVRVVQPDTEGTGAATLVEVSGLREVTAPAAGPAAALGGVRAELFDAGAQVTRGELAALLVRVLQVGGAQPVPLGANGGEGLAALADVRPGHPFAAEIGVVLRADIMRGFPDGTFLPEDLVPRQQAASFLVRALRVLEVERSSAQGPSFDDLEDAAVLHVGSIETLVGTGVLEPGGEFRPRDVLRRGEFAAWLMGVVDVLLEQRGEVAGSGPLPGYVATAPVREGTVRFGIDGLGAAAQAISVLEHGLLVGGRLIVGVTETVGHAVGTDRPPVRPGPGVAAVTVPARPLAAACQNAPADRFVDVEGVHRAGIDCVGWWQVAQGQPAPDGDGDVYRPGEPVTRAQMATFVARVLTASGAPLPADPPSPFTDTSGSVHTLAIDQLAALGVVGGVDETSYDPGGTVTRGQMASFLARSFEVRTGSQLPIGPVDFEDVRDGATHADNVRRIASAGLTGGVAPGTYDPAASVTRAQMGTFLARLLALLVVEGAAPPGPDAPRV